jgi:sn-glycerol 3-phosphate transport system substrate-binding protein
MVRHVSMLSSWARAGYFTYSGRRIEGERRFERGECAMVTASSSSAADLRRNAKFDFGVAQLPYYDDIRGAPHHSMIGGAGLWVLAGKKSAEYRGVAKFLAWLARPEVQAEWHQATGYVPVTRAAYERTAKAASTSKPGQEIAVKQLLLNQPTRESRGIRLASSRDPRDHRRGTGSGLGGEGGAKRALDQAPSAATCCCANSSAKTAAARNPHSRARAAECEARAEGEISRKSFILIGYTQTPSGAKTGHLNPGENRCASNSY